MFALVAQRAPAERVGAVTGVVGAAGYGSTHSYGGGLIALSVVAVAVLLFAALGIARPNRAPASA